MKWVEMRLEELCIKVTDGSHISPRETETGFPMASSKDMLENDFDLSSVKRISEADYQKLVQNGCKPLKDDVLLIKDGNSYLKYIFTVKEEKEIVILSSIAILRPNQSFLNPIFFQYLLRSPYVKDTMKNFVSGAAIPRIVLKDFKKIPLQLPPLPTQRKIASILSAYDDLIENNRKRIRLLEEQAFLRYKMIVREEKLEEIKLEDIAQVNNASLKTTSQINDILYVDISSVTQGSINEKLAYDIKEAPGRARRIVQHQDIIWSCVRPNRKSYAVVWKPEENLIVSTGFAVISSVQIPPLFLYQCLSTDEFVQYLENNATGSAYPAVTAKDFEQAKILIPSKDVMQEYHEAMTFNFDLIYVLQKQTALLREARDILLPRLMSGEIEV